ncbi:MAG: DMT family transporter [Clostridiales bacterium]|nr:DMT family transporter [Clostridiales bacterium]
MTKTSKKQYAIGLVMLSMTALFWGAGFVLNDQLLDAVFYDTPSLLLTLRFGISALCLLAIFNKRIRLNKQVLLYGGVGGVLLFAGFLMQTIGLKYTVPSHSGFFTASYVMYVPFITWIAYKKRPGWFCFVGVAVAVVGLVVLNFNVDELGATNTLVGDGLTVACAIVFALQIFWTDYSFKKNTIDRVQLTFWQVAFAAVLLLLYSVIFESKSYASIDFVAVGDNWWQLLIVIFGGTAFAYYAQTYAQKIVPPTETSLILGCESAIGAIFSMALLIEPFSWQTVVGGLLVLAAVILVEVAPTLHQRHKHKSDNADSDTPPSDNEKDNL